MATTTIESVDVSLPSKAMESRPLADRIVPFETSLFGDYQAFLQSHPDSTFFHGLGWKQAVERAFGHRFRGLMAYLGGDVVGVLPLYEIRSVFAGKLLVSVPYATYGGIVADGDAVPRQLFDAAAALAAKTGARSIELRSISAALPNLSTHQSHAMFVREMPIDSDKMETFFPRKARAAARKASERGDLLCEFSNDHLPEMWNLYARSMRRLASPNYPMRFFEELISAHPGRVIIQIVRQGSSVVAGLLSFLFRDRVMPYFIGLDERCDIYGLSHYLYFQSMKWGVERGYRVYDFGRSRIDNAGPFEFKRLCGFEPTMLQYQTFVAPGRAAADLSPTSAKWSAARRIWKTLPLSVTRPLGGWLARSIPG
jgi:FemAB-related protein (PEP-CTERM system-associated)